MNFDDSPSIDCVFAWIAAVKCLFGCCLSPILFLHTRWPTSQPSNRCSSLSGIGEVRRFLFPSMFSRAGGDPGVTSTKSPNDPHVENSVPPTLLATLITAQHARPFQPLPMLFPPVLLFSSYLNLSNFKTDAAGMTAAWSGLYAILAMRRNQVSFPVSGSCVYHVLSCPRFDGWLTHISD